MAKRIEGVSGEHAVPIDELFTASFLGGCSRFTSVEEFFAASGFQVNSEEDFAAIPDDQWNAFVRTNTTFSDWEQMLGSAGEAWTQKLLGL